MELGITVFSGEGTVESADYSLLIPSSQSDDCVFNSTLPRQQIIYMIWVLGW